jgi:hypothetical protein
MHISRQKSITSFSIKNTGALIVIIFNLVGVSKVFTPGQGSSHPASGRIKPCTNGYIIYSIFVPEKIFPCY